MIIVELSVSKWSGVILFEKTECLSVAEDKATTGLDNRELWKQCFVCEAKSLVLVKGDTYLKKKKSLSRSRMRWVVGGKHSKPTSCYKFAECNTGLSV